MDSAQLQSMQTFDYNNLVARTFDWYSLLDCDSKLIRTIYIGDWLMLKKEIKDNSNKSANDAEPMWGAGCLRCAVEGVFTMIRKHTSSN